jgi:hypothetical protein
VLRYKAEKGKLPETLDDLVPGYLDAVPLGPADGKPLVYRRDPDGFMVYAGGLTTHWFDGGIEETGFRVTFSPPPLERAPEPAGKE